MGLSFEDFKKCIALPQGEFAGLVKAKPSERLQLVSRLFDLEKYGDKLSATIRSRSEKTSNEAGLLLAKMQENAGGSGAICSGDAGGKESKNHGRARKGNDGQKDKKAGRSSPAAKEI